MLTDVLPTDRLTPAASPVPEIRTELRRADDRRNVGSVLLTLAQPVATIGAAIWLDNPVAWVAAFLLMGPVHARFAILAHEAAHKLPFTDKRWNDLSGGGCSPIRPSCRSTSTAARTSPTTARSSGRTSPT